MLPDDVVQGPASAGRRNCPALSLYVTLDEASLDIRAAETRVECVPITRNLRHDKLDTAVTDAWLTGSSTPSCR